jgi:hypothetical protein
VLAKFGDRRLKLVNRLSNGGVAAARNSGLRTARGQYVSFLDDDDRYYDHHLETLVGCIESRPEKVVYSDALVVSRDPQGRRKTPGSDKVEMSRDYNRALLYVMNLAQPLCFLFERELLGGSTWFDESFRTHEDWDFWIRLSDKSPFHHLAEVTCEYRRHTDGSNLSGDPRAMLETMKKIYARTALAVSKLP